MSEKGGTRPDVSTALWADGSGYARTEPVLAKKQAGYDPGPPGEIPTATDHNWLFGFWADILRYLDGAHKREFDDLGEAIAAVSNIGDSFRIGCVTSGSIRTLGQQVFSLTPSGFTNVASAASDGEIVFYCDITGAVYAANPDTGAQVWALSPTNLGAMIAADGRYLYGEDVTGGLIQINRLTGAIVGAAGTPTGLANCIAANGDYAVLGGSVGSPNLLYYYNVKTVPATETGSTSHGAAVLACAVDKASVYFGGSQSGGVDIRAHDLATRAQLWLTALPVTTAPTISDIATDGRLVYVTTDRKTLSAGGQANFHILDAQLGSVLASEDIQASSTGTDPATHVTVDDDVIYVTLGGTAAHVVAVDSRLRCHPIAMLTGIVKAYDCDGVAIIATDGAGKAERYYFQRSPVDFVRASYGDQNRSPFHKLAIPYGRE